MLDGDNIPEHSHSTHTLSLKVIGKIIQKFTGSDLFHLGIQAVETGFWGGNHSGSPDSG